MSRPVPTTEITLFETGRTDTIIQVVVGEIVGNPPKDANWDNFNKITGEMSLITVAGSDYRIFTLKLKDADSNSTINITANVRHLNQHMALLGTIEGTQNGIHIFLDPKEGIFSVLITEGESKYVEGFYEHMLTFPEWAEKNNVPYSPGTIFEGDSIVELFPQLAIWYID